MKTIHSRRGCCGRAGFSLIEILAAIVVLTLIMTLVTVTIESVMRIQRGDTASHQHFVDRVNIGDQFRGDVAQAVSAPRQWGEFKAGPHCLILAHNDKTHIVYQWDKNKLTRLHIHAGITKAKPMPGEDRVEFSLPEPRLCKLKLTAESDPSGRFANEIAASLGGERR